MVAGGINTLQDLRWARKMYFDDDDYLLSYGGLVEANKKLYPTISMVKGVIDLPLEARNKIFKAWVDLLEGCMHEEFLLEEMSIVKDDEMLVLISGEEVETRRLPDNVVQFKSKMWQHDCPVNGVTSLNPGSICDWCGAEE